MNFRGLAVIFLSWGLVWGPFETWAQAEMSSDTNVLTWVADPGGGEVLVEPGEDPLVRLTRSGDFPHRDDVSLLMYATRSNREVSLDVVLPCLEPEPERIFVGSVIQYTGLEYDSVSVNGGVVRLLFRVKDDLGEASFEFLDAIVLDQEGLALVRSVLVVSLTPTEFELGQNSPNPFNPETTIRYALPRSANIRLEVCNVLGQKVRTLVDEHQQTGSYEVTWNGLDDSGQALASGIYVYRLGAADFQATKRMVLLK